MRRVERLRRQDREYLFAEMRFEPGQVGDIDRTIDRLRSQHFDPGFGELVAQIAPYLALALHQRIRLTHHSGQLLAGSHPVGRAAIDILRQLPLQAGNADHEEFVQVRTGDRQETQPFEQRMCGVACFLEHATVEGQPGKLPVEIPFAVAALRKGIVVVIKARDMGGTGHGRLSSESLASGVLGGAIRAPGR